jgi:hypothetical protein
MKELICGSIERVLDLFASNAETLVVCTRIALLLVSLTVLAFSLDSCEKSGERK